MKQMLIGQLQAYRKRTISIDLLQTFIPPSESYASFSELILQFEETGILTMIKSTGRTQRMPSLALQYSINRQKLLIDFQQTLQKYRFTFHLAMNLDAYFALDEAIWLADLPFLEKINDYLNENGFPTKAAAAPERSYALVGDEKWMDEQGGAGVLERIGLWEKMRIFPVADPLMFAINPARMNDPSQLHIIVENKTTYQALLQVLTSSQFATLIYGVGGKISKGLGNFHDQYPFEAKHTFLYFGDIDRAGISIWQVLNRRQSVVPAQPFYEACFKRESAFGKTNQRKNAQHVEDFTGYFDEKVADKIKELLAAGAYYPQEVLKTDELQEIMLETNWWRLMSDMNQGVDG